jgi:hypothetical protein
LENLFANADYPADDQLKIEAQLWAIPPQETVIRLDPATSFF